MLAFFAVGVVGIPAAASAESSEERLLADRYAPVIRLVEQKEECGPGEPYRPMDVGALFDEPTVALRGPWTANDLVKIAPTAGDLSPGLYEYHLDFPGNALEPGCDYERWAKRITQDQEPTVYAHVVADPDHPDRLALQYWLFYAYNDWNNLHEGDWEMVQLVFDADSASAALAGRPTMVGYSQHEGAEQADWDDDKLELVAGTHPVVYPAAGSHANFFDEGLFLGSSAVQGVGCDNTSGPHGDVRPTVATIPSDPAQARSEFPWIAFEGRWGERQPAFFNGPTGPNLKSQWTQPIEWSEGWRDLSFAVPAGSAFGPTATDFFCEVVGSGSRALTQLVNKPPEFLLVLTVLALLLMYVLSRTEWRPAAPLRLARRRAWGQTLAASVRMYVTKLPLFIGLGLLFIPISLVISLLQRLALDGAGFVGVQTGSESNGLLAFVLLVIGTALTLLGLGFVQAATAKALVEIDQGRDIGALRAYSLALDSIRPLLGALVVATIVVSLLVGSFYLLPVAVWLAGRWALIAPSIELEDLSAIEGLRRSGRLVRGKWLKVTSLVVVGGALALVVGPLIGFVLIIGTGAPLWLVNAVAGVIYSVSMPLVAITTTYVYFDRRVEGELGEEREPAQLPAEIELS